MSWLSVLMSRKEWRLFKHLFGGFNLRRGSNMSWLKYMGILLVMISGCGWLYSWLL